MEEVALSRMDLREGETDAHALFERMSRGEGALVGVPVERRDMSLLPVLDLLEVGDVIAHKANHPPGSLRTFTGSPGRKIIDIRVRMLHKVLQKCCHLHKGSIVEQLRMAE